MHLEIVYKSGYIVYTIIDPNSQEEFDELVKNESNIIMDYFNDPDVLTVNGKTKEEWEKSQNQ